MMFFDWPKHTNKVRNRERGASVSTAEIRHQHHQRLPDNTANQSQECRNKATSHTGVAGRFSLHDFL